MRTIGAGLLIVATTVTGVALAVPTAHADDAAPRAAIEYRADGSVEVDGAVFASPAAFHASSTFRTGGYRCATPEPPAVMQVSPGDCTSGSTTISSDYDVVDLYRIPVVFHILRRSNGQGEISDELIRSQLDILNEDFRALPGSLGEPGTDAGIEFFLATTDPEGNPTTGINRHDNDSWYSDSGNFKSSLVWDPDRYLNIYTNTAGGALGYASFPQSSAGRTSDGVVLLWSTVGRDAPMGGVYNKGRTGTHEVGHYLGLYHTFNGGCGSGYSSGDRVADTVPESSPQYECVEAPSACGGGNNPIHNYMDYTPDSCMYRFTPEQVNRMRCSLINYRPNLFETGPANQIPEAGFTYDPAELTIAFTDTTTDPDGTVTAWQWTLGDGATSTEQNPTHTYANEGIYTVTLEVTDDLGGVASMSNDITANATPVVDFSSDVDGLAAAFTDLTTDLGTIEAWAWDFGDGATSTEQHPSHEFAADGTYLVSLTVTDNLGGTATLSRDIPVGTAAEPDAGPNGGGANDLGGGCGCEASSPVSTPWGTLVLLAAAAVIILRRRRT